MLRTWSEAAESEAALRVISMYLPARTVVTLSKPSWWRPPRMVWPWGSLTGGAVLDVDFGEVFFSHHLTSMDKVGRMEGWFDKLTTNDRHWLVLAWMKVRIADSVEGVEGLVRVGADEEYLCFHVGFGRDADW